MKLLQLCSYYSGSPLYKNMFEALDSHISQIIFSPFLINRKELFDNRYFPDLNNGYITYFPLWRSYNRLFYRNKIKKAVKTVINDIHNYDLIHAHTWFSDGGIAYELNKKYKKPYIITIRNTDINMFYRYRFDLRNYSIAILKNSKKIVLVSPSYKLILRDILPLKVFNEIKPKIICIPNGIDNYWFKSVVNIEKRKNVKNLIYVGDINKNKNIENLIKSFLKISFLPEIGRLNLVGFRGNSRYEKFMENMYKNNFNIQFIGRKTKEQLRNMFEDSDIFIMVSKNETFGLVYIEALSQGLPIVYSKGQGVDGYFDSSKIGVKVDPEDIDEISDGILEIAKNYNDYQKNTVAESMKFNWKSIALQYNELYKIIT